MVARFEPITRRTLPEEVRDALLGSIERGELPAGSQMPSERSLCEQFGVARTSVREAIQGLVSLGVVERRGNRSFVAEVMPRVSLSDPRKQSVTHIFEVRRLVEVPIAELAAKRATDEQRAEVQRIAKSFRMNMSLEHFRALDRAFHAAVAAAAGNPALAELYGKVLDTLFHSTDFDSLLTASENQGAVRQVIRNAVRGHREIATHLCAGDPEGTRRASEDHLEQVEVRMLGRMT